MEGGGWAGGCVGVLGEGSGGNLGSVSRSLHALLKLDFLTNAMLLL